MKTLVILLTILFQIASSASAKQTSLQAMSKLAQIYISNIPLSGEMEKYHLRISKERLRRLELIKRRRQRYSMNKHKPGKRAITPINHKKDLINLIKKHPHAVKLDCKDGQKNGNGHKNGLKNLAQISMKNYGKFRHIGDVSDFDIRQLADRRTMKMFSDWILRKFKMKYLRKFKQFQKLQEKEAALGVELPKIDFEKIEKLKAILEKQVNKLLEQKEISLEEKEELEREVVLEMKRKDGHNSSSALVRMALFLMKID